MLIDKQILLVCSSYRIKFMIFKNRKGTRHGGKRNFCAAMGGPKLDELR